MVQNGISISKLPDGILNSFIRDKAYESFDITRDNFIDIFIKITRQTLNPNYSLINRTLNGVCMQKLDNEAKQRLIASGDNYLAFQRTADTTSNTSFEACRVYIPEIHSDRAIPDDILNPSKQDLELIEAMFPVFISNTEENGKKSLAVGDVLEVQIKNDLGGGVYFHKKASSAINLLNKAAGKGSANSFKCKVIKHSKVITSNEAQVTAGTTITNSSSNANPIDDATKEQQYIKYLYQKERQYIKQLKKEWSISHLKGALKKAGTYGINKNFVWALMYKLCGLSPSGLSNGGNVMISAQALKDYYGIFRITKKEYDTTVATTENKAAFVGKNHSDLLDPEFAIKHFFIDFTSFLKKNNLKSDIFKDVNSFLKNENNKTKVAKYFSKNDDKKDFLFTNDFKNLADSFDSNPQPFIGYTPVTFNDFPTFNGWLIAAAGGVAFSVESSEKITKGESNNAQGPKEEKPPATPDKCHDNYPPKNSYLIHVDSQKKIVRDFLKSSISGPDLEFTSYKHRGVKNIRFAGLEIPTSFKVIRYDGNSNFYKDNKRWFDANNNKYLIGQPRWSLNYYRNKEQITHFTVQTLGPNTDSVQYYKNILHTMYQMNKPIPHFIVAPNGQIIQLVDAAGAVSFNLPNKLITINAAFGEGYGNMKFKNSNIANIGKPNYVSIREKNNNYRFHKLGTKAALQSMQKLIQFFVHYTNTKYNLAAQDLKLSTFNLNKSNIQAYGHYKGVGGMNFIYYAWTLGLAYKNNGKNILLQEGGF